MLMQVMNLSQSWEIDVCVLNIQYFTGDNARVMHWCWCYFSLSIPSGYYLENLVLDNNHENNNLNDLFTLIVRIYLPHSGTV